MEMMDVHCAFLEGTLVGVTRRGDVPSAEIPVRYVHYVRTGEVKPLIPVFEHNRLDLLSLAVLTARAVDLVEQGASATRNAPECLGLGRLYERAGLEAQAISCYIRAASVDAGGEPDVRAEALRRLALRMRCARRHQEAADVWNDVLSLASSDRRAHAGGRARAGSSPRASIEGPGSGAPVCGAGSGRLHHGSPPCFGASSPDAPRTKARTDPV